MKLKLDEKKDRCALCKMEIKGWRIHPNNKPNVTYCSWDCAKKGKRREVLGGE